MQVAVVNMTGNSYIGRLFFGDAETGNIVWDCDCRPSDACWLALKVQIPFIAVEFVLPARLQL